MIHIDFIKECLEETSKIANEMFGKVTGTNKDKDNSQVLTEADLAIGEHIIMKIKAAYPDYNIIDEEAGVFDNGSDYTWVIDPIDGTSNFAIGVPTYGIMFGLLKGNKAVAGGFVVPPANEMYLAEKGKGAYLNDGRIFVTTEQKLSNCLVAFGIDGQKDRPEYTMKGVTLLGEIILNIRNIRTSGSEPVDVGYVAAGKYGARLNQNMKIWDAVAPQIIIEEAGGVFTDFWGKQIDYVDPLSKTKQNYTCCAASPVLHKKLQDIIHSVKL